MVDRYRRGVSLGEGTWGQVYEAFRKEDNKRVAIKRMRGKEPQLGLDFTALREIKYLQIMKGQYIEELIDVYLLNGVLHLVLEFCPFDLKRLIYDKTIFLKSKHIKSYLYMILKAIQHMHAHFVLHRDLTPANILFNIKGQLKLADFGLARGFGSPVPMTAEVVTRAYRAPELLFGARFYGEGVDMWSIGCIFLELITRTILFPGESDVDQLGKIFNVLGTPTEDSWTGVTSLPGYIEFEAREALDLKPLFSHEIGRDGRAYGGNEHTALRPDHNLFLRLVNLNPQNRPSAAEALNDLYFKLEPAICELSALPIPKGVEQFMEL